MREWLKNNPEKLKQYQAVGVETKRKCRRTFYRRHRDRILAKNKLKYASNPEPSKKRALEYRLKNPEKYRAQKAAYRAKKRVELNAKQLQRYYSNHEEQLKKHAEYRQKNRQEIRQKSRERSAVVTDGYARELLSKYSPISACEWPAELVQTKIQTIKLKRLIKDHEKCN